MARVLVLCATYDHQDTLRAAIASVQDQTFEDWELVVIGDGAPERTADIVAELATRDSRIRYVANPKSPRTGEPYRDPVIRESDAEIVLQICDDDIWLPWHAASMLRLLRDADFGNVVAVDLNPDGRASLNPANAAPERLRKAFAARRFPLPGPNFVGYRRAAYLGLREGWTTTPPDGGSTDGYMWAKFLNDPRVRVVSGAHVSALRFYSGARRGLTPAERLAEIMPVYQRSRRRDWVARLLDDASVGAALWRALIRVGAEPESASRETLAQIGFDVAPGSLLDAAFPIAANGGVLRLPLPPRGLEEAANAEALHRGALDPAAASAAARRIAHGSPSVPETWYAYVGAARAAGGGSAARTALIEWCDAAPAAARPRHLLALTAVKGGRWATALELADAALARRGDGAAARYARAKALEGLGRAEEALADFDAVLEQRPTLLPALLSAGALAETLGRSAAAKERFQAALTLEPENRRAHDALARLSKS